jgi:hypothetical protein
MNTQINLQERETALPADEELSATALDTVSGGWSISFGDIVDAAKWVYHHTVGK